MALRRKEKRSDRSKLDATPPWDRRRPAEVEPTTGPFDVAHAPEDEVERIDLGALRVPAGELELRVDVSETQEVVSVTLADDTGQMQLGAFAAPRSEGIWDEVRADIRASLGQQGGTAQEQDGDFGPELTGKLPAPAGFTPVRFIGVDGPRWFLRAMLVGEPAADPQRARTFLDLLRQVVVVRGVEPLPVRDPIPLRLPPELATQLGADGPA